MKVEVDEHDDASGAVEVDLCPVVGLLVVGPGAGVEADVGVGAAAGAGVGSGAASHADG